MTSSLNHHSSNRLPLYFTGAMTVIILLVGTVLLFQIFKIQSTHVEMEGKQDILLIKLEANQKEILKNQKLFVDLSESVNSQISDNRRMTSINMKTLNETNTLIHEHDKILKDLDTFIKKFG